VTFYRMKSSYPNSGKRLNVGIKIFLVKATRKFPVLPTILM